MQHTCPLCHYQGYSLVLTAKDHTVSGEEYDVVLCNQCNFVFTLNPPDHKNIGRYYASDAYISHSDSNKGLFNKAYQLIRKYAVTSKKNLLFSITGKTKGDILDYGCGTGSFLQAMKSSGWAIKGIEADPGARQKAAALTLANIEDPSILGELNEDSFDVITLWHVLEHVHDLQKTLDHFFRILKKDGVLVIAVPNHQSLDAAHYGKYWAAYDVPRHLYHFSPLSMEKLLNAHRFKLQKILPMWFDAFYVSLLSEKYKHGGVSRVISAIVVGFLSNLKAVFKKGRCSSQIYVARKSAY